MTAENPPETSLFTRVSQRIAKYFADTSDTQLPANDDLPVTETLRLLARERRRIILKALAETEQVPLSTSKLAERVACMEYDCSSEALTADQRKRVHIALVQSHLPALSDANVISYNSDSKIVDCGSQFHRTWQTYIAILESLSSH